MNIEIKNLSFSYPEKRIFTDLNLTFPSKGIFLLLGNNGAGKSTLLKIISGFILPCRGQVIKNEKCSFFISTSLGLIDELTGMEQVLLISSLQKIDLKSVKLKIEEFSVIKELLDLKIENYSQGMKQILRLFLFFLKPFPIIILDEPFSFLSLENTFYFVNKIKEYGENHLFIIAGHGVDKLFGEERNILYMDSI